MLDSNPSVLTPVPLGLDAQLTACGLTRTVLEQDGLDMPLLERMFGAGYCLVLTRALYSRRWQLQGILGNLLDAQLLALALQARHRPQEVHVLDPTYVPVADC